jgi:hypothetical protein
MLLGADAVRVSGPNDLRRLAAELEQEKVYWQQNAEGKLRQQISELSQQIVERDCAIVLARQDAEAAIGPQIRSLESSLRTLRTEGNVLIRLYHRWMTVPRVNEKLARARRALAGAAFDVVRERDRLKCGKTQLMEGFAVHVAAQVGQQQARLARLHAVLRSPELAGAEAEREMCALLAGLPETYVVLHDLNLRLDRAIHFSGKWLKSAQCDHVVVGPTGIFVIESKRWSREFAASNNRLDPFEQVGRARFLCQCILRDVGFAVTPHDIIANSGTRLNKADGAYGRICRPEGVVSHILSQSDSNAGLPVAPIVAVLRRHMS